MAVLAWHDACWACAVFKQHAIHTGAAHPGPAGGCRAGSSSRRVVLPGRNVVCQPGTHQGDAPDVPAPQVAALPLPGRPRGHCPCRVWERSARMLPLATAVDKHESTGYGRVPVNVIIESRLLLPLISGTAYCPAACRSLACSLNS